MKALQHILTIVITLVISTTALAQTMNNVQYLMEQGKYTEAAKQLRPLADGGNAEAQTMAARLFFDGKGVNKNEAQGVKYADMAAKQGYEEAVLLLVNHYNSLGNKQKLYETLIRYTEMHPQLLKGQTGFWLSLAYMMGEGVAPDTIKACEILEHIESIDELLIQVTGLGAAYFTGKAKQAGVATMSDYYQKTRDPRFRKWVLGMMDTLDGDKQSVWYEFWRNEQANGYKPIAAIVSHWAEEGKGTERNLLVAKYLAWMASDMGDTYGKQRYQYLLKNSDFEEGEIRPEGIVIGTYGPNEAIVMMRTPIRMDRSGGKVMSDGHYHFSYEPGCTIGGRKWFRPVENDYKKLLIYLKDYGMEMPKGFVAGDGIYNISSDGRLIHSRQMKGSDYKWKLPVYLVTTIKK